MKVTMTTLWLMTIDVMGEETNEKEKGETEGHYR